MKKPADLRSTLLAEYPHFSEVFGQGFNQDASLSGFVVILFTNRTGSNLLSYYLREIFDCGGGQEVFNPAKLNELRRSEIVSFKEYIAALRSNIFSTPCIKVSAVQFNELLKRPVMFNGVTFLLSYRSDVLDQAISFEIAKKTKQWVSFVAPKNSVSASDYDFNAILKQAKSLLHQVKFQRDVLHQLGEDYMEVNYELLARSPDDLLPEISGLIGKRPKVLASEVQPTVQRQSGDLNAEWKQRFVADCRSQQMDPNFFKLGQNHL